jgi:hypothetical protein
MFILTTNIYIYIYIYIHTYMLKNNLIKATVEISKNIAEIYDNINIMFLM